MGAQAIFFAIFALRVFESALKNLQYVAATKYYVKKRSRNVILCQLFTQQCCVKNRLV